MLRDAVNSSAAIGKDSTNVEADHFALRHVVSEERKHLVVVGMTAHGNDCATVDEIEVELGHLHSLSVVGDRRQHGYFTNNDIELLGNPSILEQALVIHE